MRYTTLLCMVPPCWGCGWQTSAASARVSLRALRATLPDVPPARPGTTIRFYGPSIGAVIGVLHVDAEVGFAQEVHHFLERVAILTGDAHEVALDGRLHLLLAVLDDAHDLARLLDGDALL